MSTSYLVIEIRIKESFRVPNEDKIKNMLNWLVERIDDSDIEIIESNLNILKPWIVGVKFHSNNIQTHFGKIPTTFTKYDIIFDITKKIL